MYVRDGIGLKAGSLASQSIDATLLVSVDSNKYM